MVMVDATPQLMHVHGRMPVILHPRDHDSRLHAPAEEAMELITQYPAERLVEQLADELWSTKAKPDDQLTFL